MLKVYQILCAIWYHLYNFKNVKNIHEGLSLLKSCRLTLLKVIPSMGVFNFLINFQIVLSFTCFSHEFLDHINENVSFNLLEEFTP